MSDREKNGPSSTLKQERKAESKEAVWSFLRMAGYLDNYISNYAAKAAPLYQLTRKDAKFEWEKEEEKHSGRYKTASQTTKQWHSLTHPDPLFCIQKQATTKAYQQPYCKRLTGVYSQCILSIAPWQNWEKDIARPKKMH